MKLKILFVALFFSLGMQAQKQWSLQECVNHALENNITVRQAQNTLLANDQDIKAAKGSFLPTVGANLGQNLSLGNAQVFSGQFVDRTFHSTSAGINVSQTIFNGFRTLNLHKQSLLTKETNELELNRIKDDISLNIVNAYLNVLFNKENLERAKKQYAFTEKQLVQVKQLVDAGVQPRANIYDVEATLSNDQQSITTAENNLDLARLTLAQLLQVQYEGFDVQTIDVGSPSATLMYESVQPVLDYAYANRNEIKVSEKNIQNAELGIEIAKSGFMPRVSAGYGFNTAANFSNLSSDNSFFNQINDNKGHGFNLNVNIPIFSQFANKTNVEKAKIQVENSRLGMEQAKLSLEANIQRAFTDAKAALRTYEASKASLQAQEVAFNNAEERYKIGDMNAFDMEQARIRLLNAESALVNAKYDFVFKTKVLDFYSGKPIDVLD